MPKGEEGCVGSFESALFPEELQPESKRAIPNIVNVLRNTAEHLIPTMRQNQATCIHTSVRETIQPIEFQNPQKPSL
jgi:hypothetical protein